MPTLRLDKIIADSGPMTRSEAAALIKGGRVNVNGIPVASAAGRYDPVKVVISIDGRILEYSRFRYIMMNKPYGYVSSTEDRRDKTVMELLDHKYSRLGIFPAGRLDKDAEGLLLLTNDGDLAHRITSPSKKIDKRYFVEFDGSLSAEDIKAFETGITLGDGTKCLPAILEAVPGGAVITVNEGKYHQVKRMMGAVGKHVKYLKRIAIGGLLLDEELKPGEYRDLQDEVSLIFYEK